MLSNRSPHTGWSIPIENNQYKTEKQKEPQPSHADKRIRSFEILFLEREDVNVGIYDISMRCRSGLISELLATPSAR